jgi:hypothetical protein
LGLPSRPGERNADPDGAPARPDGFLAAWFQEAEEPVQRPVDAPLPELAAWDAWGDVRRDEAVDAAHPGLRLPWAGGAEKSAGRELDAQARDAERWQWGHRAAPAAELAAEELCTPDVVRFAERSCAALEVAELPDGTQSKALQAHSPKLLAARPRTVSGPLPAASPDVPASSLAAKTEPASMPQEARSQWFSPVEVQRRVAAA